MGVGLHLHLEQREQTEPVLLPLIGRKIREERGAGTATITEEAERGSSSSHEEEELTTCITRQCLAMFFKLSPRWTFFTLVGGSSGRGKGTCSSQT